MSKSLKLDDLDDAVVEKLSDRAMRHGRTVEAEHRAILLEALNSKPPFEELSAKLRSLLEGRKHTSSEFLMRESREER